MEKFGIFNILSSLLGGNDTAKQGNTREIGNDFPPSDMKNNESVLAEKRATFAPLQNSMLMTMRNHDEFVKRVRAKNKKQ